VYPSETHTTDYPAVELKALDQLWFQVSGTRCNIACEHCFISCSPANDSFGFMSFEQVKRYLEESVDLGVKEYYFTGGEPFMNRDLPAMLELTLSYGPATVLTNGMLLKEHRVRRLAEIERDSLYSLEIRLSLDGYTREMNDAIRGDGVFERAMEGMETLVEYDFLPIITVTKTWDDSEDQRVLDGFVETLKARGYRRPRIKILPSIKRGKEIARSRGYDRYEYVTKDMLTGFDRDQLICHSARVATDRGVAVCPILLDAPDAMLGTSLREASRSYTLRHQACYTCYLYGAICSNFASGEEDV